jgi:hypothetical protein
MPPHPVSNKTTAAPVAPPETIEEKAHKAWERLVEKWCHKASEERWELAEIEHLEKQATKEKVAKERKEKVHAENAQRAAEEKEVNEWAETVQKAC